MKNKRRIKNSIFFFFVFSFFFFCKPVSASTINNINMDVFLDQKGNASVIETWKASLYDGTEGYRGYTKLGNARIKNFSVSDDTGRVYDSVLDWDTSASFEEKKYKSGIHEITDGVELCFGISNYGNRTYTLKYEIENFVVQYRDSQGIYLNFLDLKQAVGQAKITIHSDTSFSSKNAKIWSFGYDGRVEFENGSIVLYPTNGLKKSQYMVGLIQFQENLFQTTNQSDQSFDDIYQSAFESVDDNNFSIFSVIFMIPLLLFVFIICNPLAWVAFIVILFNLKKMKRVVASSYLDFGPLGRKLPNDSEINYFRDIPCQKDLWKAYWVSYQYDIVSNITLNRNIIGAILLKWIKNGMIEVTPTKKGLFNIKDNDYAVHFKIEKEPENEIEKELYHMLLSAAGMNKILEAKEFAKWSRKNYKKVNSWFQSITMIEQEILEKEGLIHNTTIMKDGKNRKVKLVSDKVREEAIHLKGLKKFLLDFSMIAEREYFEVTIWEEYLIFAQLMGIAEKIEEQFSKLYPKFKTQTKFDPTTITVVARSMSDICYDNVIEGEKIASSHSSSSSSSSGSGGSSFSSGGRSAGGSSGGGFR